MLSTSTHDTKRSGDVRARLALLSEIPAQWSDAVRRWSALTEKHRLNNSPDRNAEYFFYQTLFGAWPLPADRALAVMEKSVRESGQHTKWNDRNEPYEAGLKHFITTVLQDCEFIADFERFLKPLMTPGHINSLGQTLLKLTAPGVPDIYQGTDLWDLSLVDPDNRRPVDFAVRRNALTEIEQQIAAGRLDKLCADFLKHTEDGRIKLFVIRQALQFRRAQHELFRKGDCVPLFAMGKNAEHVCAFARTRDGVTSITVVPRLILGLATGGQSLPIGETIWGDTRILLPKTNLPSSFRNIFTGETIHTRTVEGKPTLQLADILAKFPVALLEKRYSTNQTSTQTI
jgi:(1->4)-alpha-D-glucan 1-alpha-D-glucosylmutase